LDQLFLSPPGELAAFFSHFQDCAQGLVPGIPDSLRRIPEKYNIIIRLLDELFLSHPGEPVAFFSHFQNCAEYHQEFIYYAYTFYTALLERNTFSDYRSNWLEGHVWAAISRGYEMCVSRVLILPFTFSKPLRYIGALHIYLKSFMRRTQPLVDIDSKQTAAIGEFEKK
jgi:hypothetical protein